MKSLLALLLATVAGLVSCQQSVSGLDRFLVNPTTVTSTATKTETVTSVFRTSTSCASLVGNPTACRRRRAVVEEGIVEYENSEAIDPSVPHGIYVSAAPRVRRYGSFFIADPAPAMPVPAAAQDSARSADALIDASINSPSTDGMAEVQISNLDSVCQARAANPFFGVGLGSLFGIRVLISTTTTITQTVTVPSTSITATNVLSISGCTPTPFPYTICPATTSTTSTTPSTTTSSTTTTSTTPSTTTTSTTTPSTTTTSTTTPSTTTSSTTTTSTTPSTTTTSTTTTTTPTTPAGKRRREINRPLSSAFDFISFLNNRK